MRTPPPEPRAELLRMVHPAKVGLEVNIAPPAPPLAVFASKIQSKNDGDELVMTKPPPAATGGAPRRNVNPWNTTCPVARSIVRAGAPLPNASTIVAAAPPTPRTVNDR